MGFDKFAWVSISLGFVRVFMGFYRFIWICTRIMGIHIYIYCHYLKHMNLNMLQTRAGTTREDREHAHATQQTHARARARARKEPTSARASAHGTKHCAHERARNQTMRAQACDKTKARTRKTNGGTEPTRARAHTGKHKGRASKQTVRREKHKAQGTSKTKADTVHGSGSTKSYII